MALNTLFEGRVLLCPDFARCADDLLGGIDVSALSHVHHGRPAGGNDSPGPRACDGGRGIDSPLPVRSYEVLVVAILFITVQDHRGALGRVAILERKTVQHTEMTELFKDN